MLLTAIKKELQLLANPKKAKIFSRFFKTGKGEYGEGDKFIGLTVPQLRQIAKKYLVLSLTDLQQLLLSKIHEQRLISLFILVDRYKKALANNKKTIYTFYLKNTKYINNWDLVDLSVYKILGDYLLNNPQEKKILDKLAKSHNLWERRMAIITTFAFIKQKQLADTFKIAGILLADKHDLIHKAVGWMLRELGKIDQKQEEQFLLKHYRQMPRTMLRYAIEKFSEKKRKFYLKKQ